jgi:hypothetical protein
LLGGEKTVTLASDLMGRMVLDTESPSRLRAARSRFAKWALDSPDNTALQNVLAAIDARLTAGGDQDRVDLPIPFPRNSISTGEKPLVRKPGTVSDL